MSPIGRIVVSLAVTSGVGSLLESAPAANRYTTVVLDPDGKGNCDVEWKKEKIEASPGDKVIWRIVNNCDTDQPVKLFEFKKDCGLFDFGSDCGNPHGQAGADPNNPFLDQPPPPFDHTVPAGKVKDCPHTIRPHAGTGKTTKYKYKIKIKKNPSDPELVVKR